MILGTGVDIVEVDRFNQWLNYPKEQLLKIFSQEELQDIFSGSQELAIQRMASRYAAKEAFYKAMSVMLVKLGLTKKTMSFFSICKFVQIKHGYWDIPEFVIDHKFFKKNLACDLSKFEINVSISHEKQYAVAYVLITKIMEK